MKNNCGVYQITNKLTGDFYIGSSSNIQKRIWIHRSDLMKNKHTNRHLQRAWNKYGEDAFIFETILLCDVENKLYYEQVLLDNMKPVYNIAKNAAAPMQGLTASEETRRKLSRALMGNKRCLGLKPSEEARRHMSEAHKGNIISDEQKHKMSEVAKGRVNSEEARRKMSEAHTGKVNSEETRTKISKANKGELHWNFGKHHSEETRQKLIESHKGKTLSEESRQKLSESMIASWAKRKADEELNA